VIHYNDAVVSSEVRKLRHVCVQVACPTSARARIRTERGRTDKRERIVRNIVHQHRVRDRYAPRESAHLPRIPHPFATYSRPRSPSAARAHPCARRTPTRLPPPPRARRTTPRTCSRPARAAPPDPLRARVSVPCSVRAGERERGTHSARSRRRSSSSASPARGPRRPRPRGPRRARGSLCPRPRPRRARARCWARRPRARRAARAAPARGRM
jgi:hypothetical protein